MLYFTLPNFYENFIINDYFLNLNKFFPEVFKEKITFIQASGSFPYCSWSGGYNSNNGEGAYYDAFIHCYTQYMVPLRINFANVLLEDFDFQDNMANTILKTNENGTNLIEISNLNLMEYITDTYPDYKFVFSKQADLITPFSTDLINEIISFNKFSLIGIPDRFNNDFNFLKNIKKKSKIEITVNPLCPSGCKNYNKCLVEEHQRQLEYSGLSVIRDCNKGYGYGFNKKLKTLDIIKQEYLPIGINHFTFSSQPANMDLTLSFYIQYFIKEEYQLEVRNKYYAMLSEGVSNG